MARGGARVRMGVHTGEAQERDGDYYGPAANRAARLMGLANGGQVVVSAASHGIVADSVDDGFELVALGEHRVRGVSQPTACTNSRVRASPATSRRL